MQQPKADGMIAATSAEDLFVNIDLAHALNKSQCDIKHSLETPYPVPIAISFSSAPSVATLAKIPADDRQNHLRTEVNRVAAGK